MMIDLKPITVQELSEGYEDNEEEGVLGYGGKLDIRPPYQREFIYKDAQRDAVIDTVTREFPLNVMYWAVRSDGNFEIIDGQQRTISICQYIAGDFSYNSRYFDNLQTDEQDKILNYELMIYRCSGTDSEKLNWFKIINIAGEQLKQQELKNAVYSGSWVTDAKRYFSKTGCPAYKIASDYVNGVPIRQDYLETAIKWISEDKIDDYMGKHQHDKNANVIWQYFNNVITWVETTFKHRPEMKGVDWGNLYNAYKDNDDPTANELEEKIAKLLLDDDITKPSGIYPYVLTHDESHLSIRAFKKYMKQKVYEKQAGKCSICNEEFSLSEMEADHIKPWHEGGKTIESNCQLLCKDDNRRKSGK